MKLASYFFAMFAFVCNANTYNDWAKGNAVNLNGSSVQNGIATPSPNTPHDNGNPIGYNISSREAIFFDANGKIKYTQKTSACPPSQPKRRRIPSSATSAR